MTLKNQDTNQSSSDLETLWSKVVWVCQASKRSPRARGSPSDWSQLKKRSASGHHQTGLSEPLLTKADLEVRSRLPRVLTVSCHDRFWWRSQICYSYQGELVSSQNKLDRVFPAFLPGQIVWFWAVSITARFWLNFIRLWSKWRPSKKLWRGAPETGSGFDRFDARQAPSKPRARPRTLADVWVPRTHAP